jgi:hypothetical protein
MARSTAFEKRRVAHELQRRPLVDLERVVRAYGLYADQGTPARR